MRPSCGAILAEVRAPGLGDRRPAARGRAVLGRRARSSTPNGRVSAALSVCAHAGRVDPATLRAEFLPLVLETARRDQRRLEPPLTLGRGATSGATAPALRRRRRRRSERARDEHVGRADGDRRQLGDDVVDIEASPGRMQRRSVMPAWASAMTRSWHSSSVPKMPISGGWPSAPKTRVRVGSCAAPRPRSGRSTPGRAPPRRASLGSRPASAPRRATSSAAVSRSGKRHAGRTMSSAHEERVRHAGEVVQDDAASGARSVRGRRRRGATGRHVALEPSGEHQRRERGTTGRAPRRRSVIDEQPECGTFEGLDQSLGIGRRDTAGAVGQACPIGEPHDVDAGSVTQARRASARGRAGSRMTPSLARRPAGAGRVGKVSRGSHRRRSLSVPFGRVPYRDVA